MTAPSHTYAHTQCCNPRKPTLVHTLELWKLGCRKKTRLVESPFNWRLIGVCVCGRWWAGGEGGREGGGSKCHINLWLCCFWKRLTPLPLKFSTTVNNILADRTHTVHTYTCTRTYTHIYLQTYTEMWAWTAKHSYFRWKRWVNYSAQSDTILHTRWHQCSKAWKTVTLAQTVTKEATMKLIPTFANTRSWVECHFLQIYQSICQKLYFGGCSNVPLSPERKQPTEVKLLVRNPQGWPGQGPRPL